MEQYMEEIVTTEITEGFNIVCETKSDAGNTLKPIDIQPPDSSDSSSILLLCDKCGLLEDCVCVHDNHLDACDSNVMDHSYSEGHAVSKTMRTHK